MKEKSDTRKEHGLKSLHWRKREQRDGEERGYLFMCAHTDAVFTVWLSSATFCAMSFFYIFKCLCGFVYFPKLLRVADANRSSMFLHVINLSHRERNNVRYDSRAAGIDEFHLQHRLWLLNMQLTLIRKNSSLAAVGFSSDTNRFQLFELYI